MLKSVVVVRIMNCGDLLWIHYLIYWYWFWFMNPWILNKNQIWSLHHLPASLPFKMWHVPHSNWISNHAIQRRPWAPWANHHLIASLHLAARRSSSSPCRHQHALQSCPWSPCSWWPWTGTSCPSCRPCSPSWPSVWICPASGWLAQQRKMMSPRVPGFQDEYESESGCQMSWIRRIRRSVDDSIQWYDKIISIDKPLTNHQTERGGPGVILWYDSKPTHYSLRCHIMTVMASHVIFSLGQSRVESRVESESLLDTTRLTDMICDLTYVFFQIVKCLLKCRCMNQLNQWINQWMNQ